MISTPLVLEQLSQSRPFWLISNLSFEKENFGKEIWQSIESAHRGLRHELISPGTSAAAILTKGGWGLIPVFQPDTEKEILDFFDEVHRCHHLLLTMYVDISAVRGLAQLPHDFNPEVRFGKMLTSDRLDSFSNGLELQTYIRSKLHFLEEAHKSFKFRQPKVDLNKFSVQYTWQHIEEELDILNDENCCIQTRGKFKLYLTKFNQLSVIPKEIGRLRALTFEEIGEGSGKAIDLDEFDHTYYQLFLVDTEGQQIAGGYRIGPCDKIISTYGLDGLYTHALYHIDKNIINLLTQSIELGRSFVVRSYQKQPLPLMLLWNGILKFIQDRSQYKFIVGMVSISRVYSDISRSLIINYLKRHHFNEEIASFFTARQQYYPTSSVEKLETIIKVFNGELIHLDEFIADIEPENYRLPVLIRKYINQNAQFIGFNLDPDFSNCVDGLMILDVDQLPVSTVQLLQGQS